jgi:anti-sigma factor RsiW
MMNCDKISNALIPYAHGRATNAERRAVEAHLDSCAECRAKIEQYRNVSALLDELPVAEPSFGFDARLRARIAAEPRRTWLQWLAPSPRLAFALMLLLAVAGWVSVRHRWSGSNETLTAEKQFQMIKNLPVLEDYDVVTKFDALSDLPVQPKSVQDDSQNDEGTPDRDPGTI